MKVIKTVFLTVAITLAILLIEPIRFFAGMASFVVFGMLIVDSVKCCIKAQKISVKEKKR